MKWSWKGAKPLNFNINRKTTQLKSTQVVLTYHLFLEEFGYSLLGVSLIHSLKTDILFSIFFPWKIMKFQMISLGQSSENFNFASVCSLSIT